MTEREILKQKFMELETPEQRTPNECDLMKMFIDSNTDITLKYLMWQELILEPQVVNSDVKIEAEDIELIDNDWDDTDDN